MKQNFIFSALFIFSGIVLWRCGAVEMEETESGKIFRYPQSNDSLLNLYHDKSMADTTRLQALFIIGTNHLKIDNDSAKIIASKLLVEATHLNLPVFIGKSYSLGASACFNNTERDTALLLYHTCLKFRLENKDFIRAADTYNQLGYFYYKESNADSALKYYKLAMDYHKENNNNDAIAGQYNNFANVNLLLADYDKAMYYCRKANDLYTRTNNKKGLAGTYVKFGNIYYMKTDVRKALDNYLKAYEMNEELKNKNFEAAILANIGVIYLDLGDYEEVIRYQRKSMKLEKELKNEGGVASCNFNIGLAYRFMEDYDSALVNLMKAKDIYAEIGDQYGEAQSKGSIGGVFIKLKKYDEALKYENEALPVFEAIGAKHFMAIAHCNIATIYLGKGELQDVEYHAKICLQLTEELDLADTKRDVLEILGDYYFKTGNFNEAYTYQKEFIGLKDSLNNNKIKNEITRKDINFEYQKRNAADSLKNVEKREMEKREHDMEIADQKKITNYGIAGFVFMLVVSAVSIRAYRQKRRSEQIISQQKEIVEGKQKEITDSINYARRIQYSLLAHDELLKRNLPRHFVLFKPKDIVSGDFYWATEKVSVLKEKSETAFQHEIHIPETETVFYLAVCDSTGHGVPGAFMSLLNISFLNEAINEKNISEPDLVLNHVRERLIQNMEGSKDGMDATVVKFEGNKMIYASAMNKPLLIRNKQIIELKSDKMPIGYTEFMNPFSRFEVDLIKGDSLYFYTDGFSDQFGGPKGKKFKYSNLQKFLLEISDEKPEVQSQKLETIFENWKGDLEQVDDVCVIGIRIG